MKFRICFYIAFFYCMIGKADWNSDFDRNTEHLIREFSEFRGEYKKESQLFVKIRKNLLKDPLLHKQISILEPDQRMIFLRPKEKIAIKKRRNNSLNEAFVWELSYLFGVNEFLVPSFPMEVAHKKIILQRMEPLVFDADYVSNKIFKKAQAVDLEEYWRAHLCIYLLGLGDLVGQNIGVNPICKIRFFDMESGLCYRNETARTDMSFSIGFVAQSLEWPQYGKRLTASAAGRLTDFVRSLSEIERKLAVYLHYRDFFFPVDAFAFRLEKIRTFSFVEGKTFADFYAHVFPKMAPGLDELASLASEILGRKVRHGSALIAVSRWWNQWNPSDEQRTRLQDWIDRYIE